MYLHSLHNATPAQAYTQKECWDLLKSSRSAKALKKSSMALLERVLLGRTGIETRHFAGPVGDALFDLDAEQLNQLFEREAPILAGSAMHGALEKSKLQASDLHALFVCTCTGYLCPGLSSYIAENLGMHRHAYLQDIVGQGCGAAIPTLHSAYAYLSAYPDAKVAVVAVEVCSAAYLVEDDPAVLISACLFGDGASASIWSNETIENGYVASGFQTLHLPQYREDLRFINAKGKLKNKLAPTVPQQAANAVAKLYNNQKGSTGRIIAHPGGRDVIDALKTKLAYLDVKSAEAVLKKYGNMSSPSVLFVLEEALNSNPNPDKLWLTSFGAGFTCHGFSLDRHLNRD